MAEEQAADKKEHRHVMPDVPLPRIRDDVQLLRGARAWSGEPGWTLHDLVRNQFFQISDTDFHVLSLWHLPTAEAVAAAATAAADTVVDIDYLEALVEFLKNAELLDASPTALRKRLEIVQQSRQHTFWKALLHKYLYFRVPLVRPDGFLEALYPRVRFLFKPAFFRITAVAGFLGLILATMNWDSFLSTFSWFFTATGALVFAGTLAFVKLLHEMGHALTCKHYGLRVPTMGVAFLVMWPVLYTDATDAWRLDSRRKRVTIAAAGVITETALACYALLAWYFLPDGLAKSVAFTLATTTWLLSVAVNLNPLMRFDGYYMLADGLHVANLQDRSFALARWKMRQLLFGIDDPCPEDLPPRLIRILIGYGWAVWIYRFFLFLGIALLVYHFFFKALGVFLFAVEIWWFLLGPIWREVKAWRNLQQDLSPARRRLFALSGGALLLLLLVPWRSDVDVPALLSADRYQSEYPAVPARVTELYVHEGQSVKTGDVLMVLTSDELDFRLQAAQLDLERVSGALERRSVDADFRDRLVMQQQLDRTRAQVDGLQRARDRLTVRAAFDGTVRDLDPDLKAGQWVPVTRPLLTLVGGEGGRVIAWVSESDRDRIQPGDEALFYGDSGFGPQGLPMVVSGIETASVRKFYPLYEASVFGGQVPVRRGADGDFIPEQAVYRVHLRPAEPGKAGADPEQVSRVRGTVSIAGSRSSVLLSWLETGLSAIVRESAF